MSHVVQAQVWERVPDVHQHVAHRRLTFRLQLEARLNVLDALAQALEFHADQVLHSLQLNAQLLRDGCSNLADVAALRRVEARQVGESSVHLQREERSRDQHMRTRKEEIGFVVGGVK